MKSIRFLMCFMVNLQQKIEHVKSFNKISFHCYCPIKLLIFGLAESLCQCSSKEQLVQHLVMLQGLYLDI